MSERAGTSDVYVELLAGDGCRSELISRFSFRIDRVVLALIRLDKVAARVTVIVDR